MKTSSTWVPTAFVCTMLALTGCRRAATAGDAETAVQVLRVSAVSVAEEIIASGAIEAVDKAEVGFLVGGRVVAVLVEDGADVKQGQVLARLDPADYQQTLAIATARLAEMKSRFERLARLRELGSLTATDFEKVEAAYHEAQSSEQLARRQLDYTELRAPFDGVAVKRGIAPGLVVVPAAPVFTVLAPAPVWANVGIAEADQRRLAVGQQARIDLPAAGDEPQVGVVDAILPQADPISRSFTAKVRLENAARRFRPGNVIVARIATGRSHPAVTVPPQAVQRHPDGSLFVWVVDPVRHTALQQLVQAGPLRSTDVEITSGLKPGDQVVVSVPHTLFEGTPLKVQPAP